MTMIARDFDQNRRERMLRPVTPASPAPAEHTAWQSVRANEQPPMMFQLRLQSGEVIYYAYHDIKEIRCRDNGCVRLSVFSMEAVVVTIMGRHLRDLADLLGSGLIRWISEVDERESDVPEETPCVMAIGIEPFVAEAF